ncbi:2011_t:CDS:10 [Funneliformis caledonium]|uniref:HECT-type E3 ubiquitin transferase n=1 Tax=Funneliformis caledonium TaxID=1117310 RepID=A0A9N8ZHX1_9GLOM|nr:2011_t:CDS:10 [Funneliformis caledonium]
MGNIVELVSKSDLIALSISETSSKVKQVSSIQIHDFIEIITSLLQHCHKFVSSIKSNTHYQYHPIFKWYSGKHDSNIPNSHFNLVITQLEYLWQRLFILKAFDHVLNFKPTVKDQSNLLKLSPRKNSFSDKKISLTSGKVTIYAIETQAVCRLYVLLLKLLTDQKHDIIMNLTYIPSLVPNLWKFLMCLGPKGNMEIFLNGSVVKAPEKEPLISILELFCECCSILLLTTDDDELYDMQNPFSIETDVIPMAVFFNRFCFALLSHSSPEGYPPTIFESARRVLLQLHSRDTRRSFSEESIWLLIKDPKKSLPKSLKDLFKKSLSSNNNDKELMGMSFLDRIRDNDPISIKILNLLPHTIPFETRLEIFRDYLKNGVPIILNSEIMIRVRRDHVLDDGYKHLGGLNPVKTKGRIRVKFVNETGAEEDGVDQGGPFKEFITQLIAEAFDPSCGLFAVTPNSSMLYPNHQNTSTKITLYSFLGKMIARAIQEGILVDVQFAGFFLSKMAGRAVFLEDLIGLDDDLLKNLLFLKRYDGNVEDLGLYFAVDEESNGKVVSKDLRIGGSHLSVTNDNRIQYIYLMADYKLNKQAKEQTRAFINGFQSMIPENWLRMFSPPELQRVLSGEDVNWDVSDLRKYTLYQNGYFDQHRSIRHFWSILEEMNSNDKSAFLKFVTSCSKPPLGGFKYLQPQFTIRMISSDHASPVENVNSSRSRLSMGQVKSLFSSLGNLKSASKERLPMSSTW